jgi:hypothetical protein
MKNLIEHASCGLMCTVCMYLFTANGPKSGGRMT